MKLIFSIVFFVLNCFGNFLRPNLFLVEDKFELLQRDSRFLISINPPEYFLDPEIHLYEIKKQALEKEEAKSNLYWIYALKSGDILEAETYWKNLALKKGFHTIEFYNFLRISYLLEDWQMARSFIREVFRKQHLDKTLLEKMITFLKNSQRYEESILVLDVVSEFENFEISAREEIAEYFFKIGELEIARGEYEKILSVFSFHKKALLGMLQVCIYEEKWENASVYLKAIQSTQTLPENFFSLALQVYYHLREYEKALELAKKAPSKVKKDLEFQKIYKAILFSTSRNPIGLDYQIPEEEKKIYQMLLRGN